MRTRQSNGLPTQHKGKSNVVHKYTALPGRSGLEWEGESADRVELAGRAEPDGRGSTHRAAAPAGH